jgi:hypothetical protein
MHIISRPYIMGLTGDVTDQGSLKNNTSAFHLEGALFTSWLGHGLCWYQGFYLKLHHEHFLSHPLQLFANHHTIWFCIFWAAGTILKWHSYQLQPGHTIAGSNEFRREFHILYSAPLTNPHAKIRIWHILLSITCPGCITSTIHACAPCFIQDIQDSSPAWHNTLHIAP